LAAATLHDLGFDNATNVNGGFQAWAAAGLPVASANAASGAHDSSRRRSRLIG
jgi:3-mercaptopyruvate sulfurtransferase SseA